MLESLAGRVAVVTGGASGIGRALAEAFLGERMKVVIADIEAGAVQRAVAELRANGEIEDVVTDVTDVTSVQALADRTPGPFGAVSLAATMNHPFGTGKGHRPRVVRASVTADAPPERPFR